MHIFNHRTRQKEGGVGLPPGFNPGLDAIPSRLQDALDLAHQDHDKLSFLPSPVSFLGVQNFQFVDRGPKLLDLGNLHSLIFEICTCNRFGRPIK
jgi:hypothetical protein